MAALRQAQGSSLKTHKDLTLRGMSRTASTTTWQAVETAPPRLLKVERRLSVGRRLETIEEESGESSSRTHTCNGKLPAFDSSSKADFPKQFPSIVAG